jgi:signal peptide peptidase SppA
VARIPVNGVLVPRASAMSDMSGGTSAEEITSMMHAAIASPNVGSIVLDIDSPGGMVDGIPELAALIRAARERKPVTAVANTEAMSAAYWLGSQASAFFASPSARVGSIGVISSHENRSAQAEQKGVQTTIVSAGKYKAEGNPFEPLTDEGREHMQGMVDEFYGMFVKDVAAGRKVPVKDVLSGYGEGRYLSAKQGFAAGMIDGIATIDQVIAGEMKDLQQRNSAAALAVNTTNASAGWAVGFTAEMPEVPDPEAPEPTPDDPFPPGEEPDLEPDEEDDDEPDEDDEPETAEDENALGQRVAEASDEDLEALVAELTEPIVAVVDNTAWDGNRAMGQCTTAADYRSICAAAHTSGEPDQRQHWALPHHYLGRGPNASGVRNALSRLPQTQDISSSERARAQAHLDSHMSEVQQSSAQAPGGEIQSLEAELQALSLER